MRNDTPTPHSGVAGTCPRCAEDRALGALEGATMAAHARALRRPPLDLTGAPETLPDAVLLDRAVSLSGLSDRSFATAIMGRNERTIRNWRAGQPLTPTVRAFLAAYISRGGSAEAP